MRDWKLSTQIKIYDSDNLHKFCIKEKLHVDRESEETEKDVKTVVTMARKFCCCIKQKWMLCIFKGERKEKRNGCKTVVMMPRRSLLLHQIEMHTGISNGERESCSKQWVMMGSKCASEVASI
jgi:hypothetical protein